MKFYILIPFFYEMTSPEKKPPELQDSFLDAKMYLCHIQVTPNGSNVGPSEFLISQS